jgi:hypothetical protein
MGYSELPPKERVEAYRRLAAECLDRAANAANESEKALYLRIAAKWTELAEMIGNRLTE